MSKWQLGITSTISSSGSSTSTTSSLVAVCATNYSTIFEGNQRGGTGIIWAGFKQIGRPEFYKLYPEMKDRENPTQGGTGSLISPCSLEKMANAPWNMLLDSICNVGSWLT